MLLKNKYVSTYADLNKKTNDLLTKDFPDKPKLEVKSKRGDFAVDVNLARNADGSIFGSLFPKYKLNNYGVTLGLFGDTKRALKVELVADNHLPGLKVTATGESASESLTVDAEYKRDGLTVTGSANVLSPKGTTLKGGLVVGHLGYSGGISAEYHTDKISKIDTSLSFNNNLDLTTNVYARINPQDSSATLGFSHYQNHSRGAFAVEGSFDPSKTTQVPKITLAGSYNLDDKSIAKAKFDTAGRLGLSFGHKLASNIRFILGTSINTQNPSAPGDHSLGFSLHFD